MVVGGQAPRRTGRTWVAATLAGALLVAGCAVRVDVATFCQPSPGQILFGADLTDDGASLTACSGSFSPEGDLAFVGVFSRHVTGMVVLEVSVGGGQAKTAGGYAFTSPGNYFGGRWHLRDLDGPGTYALTMKLDGEVLAIGTFMISE